MHRRSLPRLIAGLLLITGLTAGAVSSSGADGPRPGLPATPPLTGDWASIVQGGAAEAKKAKQWARVPMQVSTLYAATELTPVTDPADPRNQYVHATNFLFLMAEKGARYQYGLTAPFSVSTVAFGSIPVTATLRMAQRRTTDGLPIALIVDAWDDYYAPLPPGWPGSATGRDYHDTDVEETLHVDIESLQVDGQDLGLKPGCRATNATIRLHGEGFIDGEPGVDTVRPWETGHFAPGKGGLLTGTVDVPDFKGCVTKTGENVSALLTATVSGPGNKVTLHVSDPGGQCTEQIPQPGDYDASTLCPHRIPGQVHLPPVTP